MIRLIIAALLVGNLAGAKEIPKEWWTCMDNVQKECKANIGKLPADPKDATDAQKSAVENCIQKFLECSSKYLPKDN